MKVILETRRAHLIWNLCFYNYERYWWTLFQKHVVHTKFDIYIFITMNVPDEGYSRNSSCTLNLISIFITMNVPDEGYFRNTSCTLNLISTFL